MDDEALVLWIMGIQQGRKMTQMCGVGVKRRGFG
jgi:hypothetical protein